MGVHWGLGTGEFPSPVCALADDPLEARVRVTAVMLGSVSRESEISLGEKNPKGADFGLSLEDPNILIS